MEHMRAWVEDLAGKNQILQSKNYELEQENKTLKMMNQKLTDELHVLKMPSGHGHRHEAKWTKSHGHEEMNPPGSRKRTRVESGPSNPRKPVVKYIPMLVQTSTKTKTNPLEIDKIVKHLMGFVRPVDLLKCRQVCKLWKKATEKDFQERVTFRIDSQPVSEIRKFMEYARNDFPMFRKLRLDLEGCQPERRANMRALFLSFGKNLHKLQLNFSGESTMKNWSMDDLRDILATLEEIRELQILVSPWRLIRGDRLFLPHHIRNVLKSLRILKLELHFSDSTSAGEKTQFFLDLLQLAPNLKTLFWRSCEEYQGVQLIKCLIQLNPTNLENLFIHNWIPVFSVESLANSQLQLKKLYLKDYKDFGLDLVTTPYGKSEVTPRRTVYGNGISSVYVKKELEKSLSRFVGQNVSCTRMLGTLTALLNYYLQYVPHIQFRK